MVKNIWITFENSPYIRNQMQYQVNDFPTRTFLLHFLNSEPEVSTLQIKRAFRLSN